MKKILGLLIALNSLFISGQNDCSDAIIVCGNSGYQDLSVTGFGVQELNNSNVCSSKENNSIWFKLTINTSGTLGFTLTPTSNSIYEDFDFFVFGPDVSCGNIGQAIRCSTTNPFAAGQGNNLTGMNGTETDTSEGPGTDGNSFIKWLDVVAGQSYFLVVDRPVGTSNFSIEWTGTATFNQQPTFDNLTPETLNIEQCDTDSILDGISTFDLTVNDNIAIGTQNNVEITYHTSNNDAILGENKITTPQAYQNTINPQIIYVRLTNTVTQCYTTAKFTLTVSSIILGTPITLTACDPNNTGFYNFDLTQNDVNLVSDIANYTISYFDNETDALTNNFLNKLPSNYTNKVAYASEKIWVRVENNNTGCYNISSFDIEVYSKPIVNPTFTFKQCDEDGTLDGFTDFNLNEANTYLTNNNTALNVTYYASSTDAESGSNVIIPFPFSNKTQRTVYARIENANGCYRIAQVDLLVSSTHFPIGYLKKVTVCDTDDVNDGTSTFILANNDADIINLFPTGQNLSVSYYRNLNDVQLEQNEIDKINPYSNEVAENQTIYVRVESEDNGACFGLGPHLQLIVNKRPEFELDSTTIYCQNLAPIIISPYNQKGNYTYEWYNSNGDLFSTSQNAVISSEGLYTVYATSIYGCESFPKTIQVNPSIIATITQNNITVIDDTANNSITINTSNLGIGDYEFALDEISGFYQNDPVFTNVAPGIHTIYIQDKNNCGIAQIDVSVIGYPKFFTPNNDGINDTWKVLGVDKHFYPNSNIYIFDRFGKLIIQIDPKSEGWNGTFNGQYLPASDYWFSVELIDYAGNIKIRKGHFSLIRR
ncbi:T9SS type B sorting domain-containing protein [Lutibacter sp.]|uniref:T9SS type B sorting domain-containing protein n=1 Tax=Lutibacter sp. TaxID=1925666 RepID=UPI0025BDC313|nr:T9SS type B sorting domain-containing protein [Lutibacter sp.]MCF6182694.1 T9SS type B sorting domain-containing protein [Lutibacter sp.]